MIHPEFHLFLNDRRTVFDYLRERYLARLLCYEVIILTQHQFVCIDASDAALDALGHYVRGKFVGTM